MSVNKFKIGITGSHNTGKTTLASSLVVALKSRNYRAYVASENVKNCSLGYKENATVSSQLWIFGSQVRLEELLANNEDIIICDKTVIDTYCYGRLAYEKDPTPTNERKLNILKNMTLQYAKTYDELFLVPINEEIPSSQWSEDVDDRQRIDEFLRDFLNSEKVPYTELKSSMQDRTKEVLRLLFERGKIELPYVDKIKLRNLHLSFQRKSRLPVCNLDSEGERYKLYLGRAIDQMPILLSEGRNLLSIFDLAKRKLDTLQKDFDVNDAEVREQWFCHTFCSSNGCLFHPNGNLKVVLSPDYLLKLTPQTSLIDGFVPLGSDSESSIQIYNSIQGEEFTKEQIRKNCFETVWLTLFKNDRAFLDEYRSVLQFLFKNQFKEAPDDFMGISLRKVPSNFALGGIWNMGYTGSHSQELTNCKEFDSDLNFLSGFLVGVLPQ